MTTDSGTTLYNIWRAAGAETLTAEPQVQRAKQTSGLPAPSTFVRTQMLCPTNSEGP